MTFDPSAWQAVDSEASILMKRGIGLAGGSSRDAIVEALSCFDGALDLRRRLPIETIPIFCYGLAACWLNRADALMRLSEIPLALAAFDEAIRLLRTLPLDDDPRFVRRMAIAYQNRGLALQALGAPGVSGADVIDAFVNAVAILEHQSASTISDRDYLLSAVLANLANAQASGRVAETDALARAAALRAMALVAALEETDADAADVGLKARHVLSQTVARRLSRLAADGDPNTDDVHEATDLADEGLGLIRRWEHRGVTRFRDLALDLFRFGALVYGQYQRQFLPEFILENMDPDQSSPDYVGSAEMQAIARQHQGALADPDLGHPAQPDGRR